MSGSGRLSATYTVASWELCSSRCSHVDCSSSMNWYRSRLRDLASPCATRARAARMATPTVRVPAACDVYTAATVGRSHDAASMAAPRGGGVGWGRQLVARAGSAAAALFASQESKDPETSAAAKKRR